MYDLLFSAGETIYSWFLSSLPNLSIPQAVIDKFFHILTCVIWFFPMDTVFSILSIIIAIQAFRVCVAALTAIWNVLPLL